MGKDDYDDKDYRRPGGRADTDLVLAPGEYAYIQDGTKGNISVYVGPQKTSLSQTDIPVNWDPKNRVYNHCEQSAAIHPFPSAPEGFYMVLQNPAPSGKEDHPQGGKVSQHVDLNMGRKINIPGPATFPLWPGQSADAVEGHRLRSNQYLLVRIYNDEEAQHNWDKAVIKPQSPEDIGQQTAEKPQTEQQVNITSVSSVGKPDKLTIGQLIIVKGINVSFYIPPTGVEVVPDENRQFVRNAATLERLEYCILLDESGDKRYVVGPDVVFPKPTETFVEGVGDEGGMTRKFRAIELNEIQGIYVKVIAGYKEGGKEFRAGDELFITGKEQAIYYPRPEHSIIKYGDQTKHYAVAVPAGEARYVLDRMSGAVELVCGPKMFLADPRKQVIVRRILSTKELELWFPSNAEAFQVNALLRQEAEGQGTEFVTSKKVDAFIGDPLLVSRLKSANISATESFQRGSKFTEPRTITLNSKYDGSVRIEVWPGYAVLVVSKTGKRRVVMGPETSHLEYDETLLPMTLSTGRPKTDDKLIRTVYLKVRNNTVSDLVLVETKDLCEVRVEVSYRVNFTGENPQIWFEVDNYVKFLTDHIRSLLRHAIKQRSIEDFYQNATSIVRDTVLGIADEESEGRPGRNFEENGMHVYDVEILDVKIGNSQIAALLVKAQQEVVETGLKTAALERTSAFMIKEEELKRSTTNAKAETASHQHSLDLAAVKRQLEFDMEKISNRVRAQLEETKANLDRQKDLNQISEAELSRTKAKLDQDFAEFNRRLESESSAIQKQVGAVGDKLSEALILAAHANLAEQVSKDMAPLVALGGGNAEEMFNRLVAGTFMQDLLARTRGKSKQSVKDE